jgi:hypothetical protein
VTSSPGGADPERKLGVDLFNYVWTLLERTDRTPDEDDEMLHAAHASRHHWGKSAACRPENLARGEWQVSRVYSVLRRGEPALYHARRCLELCQAHGLGDFDLAYAYEALSRAAAVADLHAEAALHAAEARTAGDKIAEADDREQFARDLATLPHPD